MSLLDKVRVTVKRYRLIEKKDRIVVGVSGGPDSVVLLHLLNRLKKELDLYIHVAHLDHMLRPDSGKDTEFVKNLSNSLNLPATAAQINIKKLAKNGSIEEIARNSRLDFLFKLSKEVKANKIALGHNLDDQAETVLMRILRGTGLYGLSGILPKRKFGGFTVIRPLIETRRKDIEGFLKKRRIRFRLDKTNLKDTYFRNKIRHKLIPLLEKEYSGNIKEILSNMAENVGYDYEYLNKQARRVMKSFGVNISITRLLKLHPSMLRLILRLEIAKVQGDTRRITFQHIKEIEELISSRPVNSIVDLPKGLSVAKSKKILLIYKRNNSS